MTKHTNPKEQQEILRRGKELAEKYKGEYWKLNEKEPFLWQWDDENEIYVPEYSDKQL
jgi:hypothetical protein